MLESWENVGSKQAEAKLLEYNRTSQLAFLGFVLIKHNASINDPKVGWSPHLQQMYVTVYSLNHRDCLVQVLHIWTE